MSLNNGMVINFASHYFAIIFFSWIRSTWSLSDSRMNLLHGLQVGYRYLKTQFSSKSLEQLLVACSSLGAWFLWKYLALFATYVRLLMVFSWAWVRFSPSPVSTYASRRRLPRHGLSTCVVTVLKFGHINVFFCYLRFERLYMYEHFRDCSTITPSRLLRKLSTFDTDKRVFNFRESWYNVVHIKYYANIHEIKNTTLLLIDDTASYWRHCFLLTDTDWLSRTHTFWHLSG